MKFKKNTRIFITGHKGMLGQSILTKLKNKGFKNIITVNRKNLDLTNQKKVNNFFKIKKPEVLIMCAAKVGGILSNLNYSANYIYENIIIQANLIEAARSNKIKKIIFFSSNCVYPKNIKRRIRESDLLTGLLEKSSEPYSIAKIAGIKMGEAYFKQHKLDFLTLVPSTIYGPGDNYDSVNSHFFSSIFKKIYFAKKNKKDFCIWGSGRPKRELIYVDDVAEACIFFMMKKTKHRVINLGGNIFLSINKYAQLISKYFKCKQKIIYEKKKPDGTFSKRLNNSIAKKYGWSFKYNIDYGIKKTYEDFTKRLLNKNKYQKKILEM